MWEAIVEKLLSKYLSEYVDGIEKERLQVGVLRGDIELCDLSIKPGSLDEKALGMSVLYGRIGRLAIGISWSKWMAQDYDLRVRIEHVHVLLKPYVPDSPLSLDELRQQLRAAKEIQVLKLEKAFFDAMKSPQKTGADTKNQSTFLMDLTSRLIRNIEIEVIDVHITFHDPNRNLTLGCFLDSGCLLSTTPEEINSMNFYNTVEGDKKNSFDNSKQVNKRVEFRGFSIYVGLCPIPEWKQLMVAFQNKDVALFRKMVPELLVEIQASLDTFRKSQGISSGQDREDTVNRPLSLKNFNNLLLDYVLFPLDLFFYLASTKTQKRVAASFGEESRGLSMGSCHLKMLIEFFREASEYRRYCRRVLTGCRRSVNVRCEDIGETRAMFSSLYAQKLRYEAGKRLNLSKRIGILSLGLGLTGYHIPLSESDAEKLILLHDVISVRLLAKWRALCLIELEKAIQAKQNLMEKELAIARKQQSWWGWATKGSESLEIAVLEKVQQEEPTLTFDEAKFVSDAVVNEMAYDKIEGPTLYEFSVRLPQFYVSIRDLDGLVSPSSPNENSTCEFNDSAPFLELAIRNLQARAQINSCIDRNDKDAYSWRWNFLMSDLILWHRRAIIVTLNGLVDTKKEDILSQKNPDPFNYFCNSSVNKEDFFIKKSDEVKNVFKSVQNRDLKTFSDIEGSDMKDLQHMATIWDIEHSVSPSQGEYRFFILMAPLKVFLTQFFVMNIVSFLVFLFRGYSKAYGASTLLNNSFTSEMKEEAFYDGVVENYERFFLAVQEKAQDLIKIRMILCAPIVHYKSSEHSGALVHFGQLCITSGKSCTLRDITLNISLNDTQIACWSAKQEYLIPVIRPIPIELTVSYDPTSSNMSIDLLFHELFIEINPSAFEILLEILANILSLIAGKRYVECLFSDLQDSSVSCAQDLNERGHNDTRSGLSSPDLEKSLFIDSDDSSLAGLRDNRAEVAFVFPAGSEKGLFQYFTCTTTVFIRRVGFSLFNNSSAEILRAGAVDMSIKIEILSRLHQPIKIDADMVLHAIFASDPSTRTPLFLTLHDAHSDLNDYELFGETYKRQGRFMEVLEDSLHSDSQSLHWLDNASVWDILNRFANTLNVEDHWKTPDREVKGSAQKRFKEMQEAGVESFIVHYNSLPFSLLKVYVNASCEINWKKNSIQNILITLQEFRSQAEAFLKVQIAELRNEREHLANVTNRNQSLYLQHLDALGRILCNFHTAFNSGSSATLQFFQDSCQNQHDASKSIPMLRQSVQCLGPDGLLPDFCCGTPCSTSFHCQIVLHTTSFYFWLENEKFAQGSLNNIHLQYTQYTTADAELCISVGQINFFFKNECIVTSTDIVKSLAGTSCETLTAKSLSGPSQKNCFCPPIRVHIKFYETLNTSNKDSLPYNSCISIRVSRLAYIYFQKDLSELYAYLCDGVLDVILRKSYEVAYHLVKSSCVLFGLYVDGAVVLVPEDKTCIPQSPFYFKKNKDNKERNYCNRQLGSFISFSIPSVSVRNGYTLRSSSTKTSDNIAVAEIQINVDGLSASMVHSNRFNSFSNDVNGQVLQRVVGIGRLTSGNPFLIDFYFSHVFLSLNREQLTLLLDILNENLAGLGYNPASIQLEANTNLHTSINLSWFERLDNTNRNGSASFERSLEESLTELFANPPSRFSIRGRLDTIQLNIGFSPDTPLAQLNTHNISVSCDVSLYGLYTTYRFALLAEYLILDDKRVVNKNVYKRFLECLPDRSVAASRNRQAERRNEPLNCRPAVYSYYFQDDLPGTEPLWMRPGIELKPFGFNSLSDVNEENKQKTRTVTESISFSFVNNVTTTCFSATLWNPTVYVFTVGMQDLLDFVVASFSYSTMRRFPKPVPSVVTAERKYTEDQTFKSLLRKRLNNIVVQTRPFLINVVIHQGVFNLFSQLDSLYESLVQFKGNFRFRAESVENYILFKSIDLLDCVLSLVNISPKPNNSSQTPDPQDTGVLLKSKSLVYDSPSVGQPLITILSSVVISKAFSFKASGLLETVYDAVAQRWYTPLSCYALSQETSNSRNQASGHGGLTESYAISFCSHSERKHESPEAQTSLLRIDVEISECVVHVSVEDLATICSALSNVNQDLPFVSPKTPYPPIVAVDSLPETFLPEVSCYTITNNTTPYDPEVFVTFKSKLISFHRYSSINLTFKGIRVVLFDNSQSTPTPIMKFGIAIGKLNLSNSPSKFSVTVGDMSLSADCMSQRAGEWQPFVEQLNVTWGYVRHTSLSPAAPKLKKYELQSTVDLQELNDKVRKSGRTKSSLDDNKQEGLSQEWSNFTPESSLTIVSGSPLVVNIVPDLFQLLTWVISLLEITFKPKLSSYEQKDSSGKREFPNRLEGLTESQPVTETTYHYLNLTGRTFTAFTVQSAIDPEKLGVSRQKNHTEDMEKMCAENESVCQLYVQSVQQLEPTTTMSSLNKLAIGHYATQLCYQSVSVECFYIFLTCNPPKTAVSHLQERFPHIPEPDIIRSLLVTRSERATLNSLLSIPQLNSKLSLPKGGLETQKHFEKFTPTPKFLGDFPRRMPVVPIVLSRTGRSLVSIDYELLEHDNSIKMSQGNAHTLNLHGQAIPKGPSAVARVLSHHPSCKLLMLTTNVLIENHSGFPLQIAFLHYGLQSLPLSSAQFYCTPCSVLRRRPQENSDENASCLKSPSINQKRTLQFPELSNSVSEICLQAYNAKKESYAVCVPDDFLVSAPPSVFFEGNRVTFSFRPAFLESEVCNTTAQANISPNGEEKPLIITPDNGWCSLFSVDCEDSSDSSPKSSVRSCRIPFSKSSIENVSSSTQSISTCPFLRGRRAFSNETTTEIHLTIVKVEDQSPFSKDAPLFFLKIFPAFTLINACPVSLDILLFSNSSSCKAKRPVLSSTVDNSLLSYIQHDGALTFSLSLFTIFHLYTVSPLVSRKYLRMRLKFSQIPESQWSSSIKFYSTQPKDDILARLFVDCGDFATVELEVYKQVHKFLDYIPGISKYQRSSLISSPRWFIDRSDLNVRVVDSTSQTMKLFPTIDKICLLGNSDHPEIQLTPFKPISNKKKCDVTSLKKSSSCFAEIPAIGEFSNTFLQTDTFYYVFCLQTVQVNPHDIFGVVARCISLIPKYIFTNTFEDESVWVRQVFPGSYLNHANPVTECSPKKSILLYWADAKHPLSFQFKVGGYHQWSGPISPTDEFVGGHDIAVMKENELAFSIFHIQIISDNGVISTVLRSIADPQRTPLHSVLFRNRLKDISIWFRTFHSGKDHLDMKMLNYSDRTFACFKAAPMTEILLAWPLPFSFKEFVCGVELLDKDLRSLRSSAIFKIYPYTTFHKRCLEVKNLPLPYRVFIFITSRGNTIYIECLADSIFSSHDPSLDLAEDQPMRHDLAFNNAKDASLRVCRVPDPESSRSLQVIVYLSQICLSCVSAVLCQELLYAEISSICTSLLQKNESQFIEFTLNSIQIDSQLEDTQSHILLKQRQTSSTKKNITQLNEGVFLQEIIQGLLPCTSRFVVFDSLEEIKRNLPSRVATDMSAFPTPGVQDTQTCTFIHVWVERESISSTDLYLRSVNVTLSDLELDIDTEMLFGFQTFMKECLEAFGLTQTQGVPLHVVFLWRLCTINKDFKPPRLGKTVTLKRMSISKFSIVVWCSLLLDKVDFLSDFLKIALRILMVSPTLELVAAPISFESEVVDHSLHGSLFTLLTVMKSRYIQQSVSSLGSVLGYSSLANIPRAPFDLFRGTVGLGLAVTGSVSLGLGTVLSNLTFDADYIAKREQACFKAPSTVRDGLVSATKELREGFVSLGEVVRKPMGGAQRDGFVGFIRGLGKGVAGTIFKPVDKLSHAISNVASGIHAEYIVRDHKERKIVGEKRRKPRMLTGPVGLIRKYNFYEADLRECLTLKKAQDILRSITIPSTKRTPSQQFVLLIYFRQLSLLHLFSTQNESVTQKSSEAVDSPFSIDLQPFKPSKPVPAKSAQIIWTVSCCDITSVRASTHGVMIISASDIYQISCKDAATTVQLYNEILMSQQRAKPTVLVENIVEWIGRPSQA